MGLGLPIHEVLGDPLAHTSCYTTSLEIHVEPIFSDLVFHVFLHHQSVLFFLKAILDLLSNVGQLVLSGMVLLKACLL